MFREYARINNIKKLELDELVNLYSRKEIDLGLSCRFSKIIRKPIIDLFSKGIINMHGGLLPEFGGYIVVIIPFYLSLK